ncbi:MAG: hypothetical protein GX442_11905 [Candidatus Riflebacteria bacterium]|nr:hypothetical protein [Candidatus Riflebacteria bacterium]
MLKFALFREAYLQRKTAVGRAPTIPPPVNDHPHPQAMPLARQGSRIWWEDGWRSLARNQGAKTQKTAPWLK